MVRECTSNTRRFWLRGRRVTEAFLNGLLAMCVGCIEHKVFIRGAPSGSPSIGKFVVQRRGLATNFGEFPVAEGEALMLPHLRLDVPVDWAVEVLRIQVEREFLPEE